MDDKLMGAPIQRSEATASNFGMEIAKVIGPFQRAGFSNQDMIANLAIHIKVLAERI